MLRNYCKIAFRNLQRHKVYALINVLGLALGMGCGILIFTLVQYHLSFDTFHPNADRIYRVYTEFHEGGEVGKAAGVPRPFGKAFRNDYTFAEKVARVVTYENQVISIFSEKEIKKFREEPGVAFVEPSFFDILNFPLVQGDMKTALADPNTALITEKLAKKYFGEKNPMGQLIRLANKADFKITGVLRNLPENTDRRQEIYVSYPTLPLQFEQTKKTEDFWGNVYNGCQVLVLLKPQVSVATVEKALRGLVKKIYEPKDIPVWHFKLQPIADIHFNPELNGFVEKKNLWALALIGLFLVVTACVNFINLATAQALNRSKEVGVRKVLGSSSSQLFWQFIAETTLITVFSVVLAFGLAQLVLPYLNQLFETHLTIQLLKNPSLVIFSLLLMFTVVLLSGSYPGLILTRFQPVLALKGKLTQHHVGGFSIRRVLVVGQFALSQMLIIGTLVITSQMRYSKQSDLGFNKETVVMLPVPMVEKEKMSTLRNRFTQLPDVEQVSFCNNPPASKSNWVTDVTYDNRPEAEKFSINYKAADENFVPAFGLQLVAGRNLFQSDSTREYLVNETFVKMMKVKTPSEILGKNIEVNGVKAPIVGVVNDFHNLSFHEKIEPLCIAPMLREYRLCAVKIQLSNVKSTLVGLEKIWNDTYPAHVYESQFLDERIAEFYKLDDMMLQLIQAFTAIAIFIACMGLYGLVSFIALQKTKEIGIRKVLGATVTNIVSLFTREFFRLIVLAFVIAAPIAWWVMNTWLEDFIYRINIGAGVFGLTIASTLLIATLTVTYQSVRSALANPVKSLRTE